MTAYTIIFLHIPKTGGTSLQTILLRKYSKDEVFVNAHKHLDEVSKWPEDRKRKVRYLQGHFSYGAHKIFSQDCNYITILRDPIDRVISHYYFLKRNTIHPLSRVIENQKMDLEDYVTSDISDEVSNDQARLIASVPSDSTVTMNEMLNIAKGNIDDKFLVAGLLEQFDETLILLKRRLGLRNIFYGVRNQTIDRPLKEQVPENILCLISERNSADMELYAYAREKLAEMMQADGDSFINDVRRFKLLNRPYSNAFRLVRNIKHKLVSSR